jgi:hypothetical protein
LKRFHGRSCARRSIPERTGSLNILTGRDTRPRQHSAAPLASFHELGLHNVVEKCAPELCALGRAKCAPVAASARRCRCGAAAGRGSRGIETATRGSCCPGHSRCPATCGARSCHCGACGRQRRPAGAPCHSGRGDGQREHAMARHPRPRGRVQADEQQRSRAGRRGGGSTARTVWSE